VPDGPAPPHHTKVAPRATWSVDGPSGVAQRLRRARAGPMAGGGAP